MAEEKPENCMTCKFSRSWIDGDHWQSGECHRHAPQPISYSMLHKILFPDLDPQKDAQLAREDSEVTWPNIIDEDWCGEWQPK